jgi:3-hydroxy-D-aspartate aldolase
MGNTDDYVTIGSIPGITEVTPGAYALMDYRHLRRDSRLKPAVRVLSTVTSHPDPHTGTIDAGQKAIGADTGLPVVDGLSGASLTKLSAEHGSMSLDGELQGTLEIGNRVWLIPWDIGVCMNLYDYLFAVRDGVLEGVWEISARGRYK